MPRFFLFLLSGLILSSLSMAADVGLVALENSGKPAAQSAFLRGLAQLHNFEYSDAAEEFRNAQQVDPDFALAYWGEALTYNHPIWKEQDFEAGRAVLEKLGATDKQQLAAAETALEKDLIHSIQILYGPGEKEERDFLYRDFLANLWKKYPGNPEVGAMYALSIMGTAHEGRDFATYMRSAAITTELFEDYPQHPGIAHYLIHATDDPIHAPLGYRAALAYSEIAPNAAHAQHMTSHIFLALGLWDRTAKANDTAVAVVNRQREADQRPTIGCGHYPSWQMYAYLQQERWEDAANRMQTCYQRTQDSDGGLIPFYFMKGMYLFETGDWDGAVADFELQQEHDAGEAFAAAYIAAVRSLKLQQQNSAEAVAAALEAAGEYRDNLAAAGHAWDTHAVTRTQIMTLMLRAWHRQSEGRMGEAEDLLREAMALQEELPFGFGPPYPSKPAIEALADLLLEAGRNEEAAALYERSLERTLNRRLSVEGLSAARAAADS